MLQIHQFPCLSDNYGFLAHDPVSGETAAIDTPDATEYLKQAELKGWTITQIWNTHWHPDHAGGNQAIKDATGCAITGPRNEADKIPAIDRTVGTGDTVRLGDIEAVIMDVPGHTLGHIAYHIASEDTAFVGDAVFALGCGRVFEGTPDMMWSSLSLLKRLPPQTALYCAHEYTAANAKFAITIEPDNPDLTAYIAEIEAKRAKLEWTVPTQLSRELQTNPFLRADEAHIQAAMGHPGDAVATFAEIRGRKDKF
ncbi:MAG: hydroxyacylglutathione hydrolase [Hyphomonadaceae bacterium]